MKIKKRHIKEFGEEFLKFLEGTSFGHLDYLERCESNGNLWTFPFEKNNYFLEIDPIRKEGKYSTHLIGSLVEGEKEFPFFRASLDDTNLGSGIIIACSDRLKGYFQEYRDQYGNKVQSRNFGSEMHDKSNFQKGTRLFRSVRLHRLKDNLEYLINNL